MPLTKISYDAGTDNAKMTMAVADFFVNKQPCESTSKSIDTTPWQPQKTNQRRVSVTPCCSTLDKRQEQLPPHRTVRRRHHRASSKAPCRAGCPQPSSLRRKKPISSSTSSGCKTASGTSASRTSCSSPSLSTQHSVSTMPSPSPRTPSGYAQRCRSTVSRRTESALLRNCTVLWRAPLQQSDTARLRRIGGTVATRWTSRRMGRRPLVGEMMRRIGIHSMAGVTEGVVASAILKATFQHTLVAWSIIDRCCLVFRICSRRSGPAIICFWKGSMHWRGRIWGCENGQRAGGWGGRNLSHEQSHFSFLAYSSVGFTKYHDVCICTHKLNLCEFWSTRERKKKKRHRC